MQRPTALSQSISRRVDRAASLRFRISSCPHLYKTCMPGKPYARAFQGHQNHVSKHNTKKICACFSCPVGERFSVDDPGHWRVIIAMPIPKQVALPVFPSFFAQPGSTASWQVRKVFCAQQGPLLSSKYQVCFRLEKKTIHLLLLLWPILLRI